MHLRPPRSAQTSARRAVLVAFALASGPGCQDPCTAGDRGVTPPDGPEETESCAVAAPDATRVRIAGRVFCDLAEFPVDPIVGDYHDHASAGFRLDTARFKAALDAIFTAPGPRGYAWTLIQAGRPAESRVIAQGSGGLAVTARDLGAAIDFTTRTPSNIGSVTKFIAAVGLVHAHERVVAALPPDERYSLRQLLNVPFFALLPARWQQRFDSDNGLREVTIGRLLLHTSRLVGSERDPGVDDIVEGLTHDLGYADLADNPSAYANLNYRLLFVIIAALLDPEGLREVEREHAGRCDAAFDDAYLRAAAVRTRAHLETAVFAAVPGGMPATDCDPTTFGDRYWTRIAWAYRDGRDGAGSTYDSYTTNPGYCSTTGGYYSSTDDLGALLHAYHGGLIAPEHRAILEGGSGMGWHVQAFPRVRFDDLELDATGVTNLLRKHGGQPIAGTDDVYRASVYKLPYGHYLAVLVNSNYADGSTTSARTFEIARAFGDAFSLE